MVNTVGSPTSTNKRAWSGTRAGQDLLAPRHPAPGQRHHHWGIEVCSQESRESNVPAAPKLNNAGRFQWRVEVHRQSDTDHSGEPERHLGVARKIEIELQCEPECACPGIDKRYRLAGGGIGKNGCDMLGDAISNYRLFEQTDREQAYADSNITPVEAPGRLLELWHHFPMMHDWSGDQMREEDHEQHEVEKAEFLDLATVHIHQQCDLLECVERDAERQQYRRHLEVRAAERIYRR